MQITNEFIRLTTKLSSLVSWLTGFCWSTTVYASFFKDITVVAQRWIMLMLNTGELCYFLGRLFLEELYYVSFDWPKDRPAEAKRRERSISRFDTLQLCPSFRLPKLRRVFQNSYRIQSTYRQRCPNLSSFQEIPDDPKQNSKNVVLLFEQFSTFQTKRMFCALTLHRKRFNYMWQFLNAKRFF